MRQRDSPTPAAGQQQQAVPSPRGQAESIRTVHNRSFGSNRFYARDSSRPLLSPNASTGDSMRSSIDRNRLFSGVSFS